jgi:hypothetical protein
MMNTQNFRTKPVSFDLLARLSTTFVGCVLVIFTAATLSAPAQVAVPQGKAFSSPDAAIDAFIAAAGSFDVAAMQEILGPESRDLIQTADPVQGRENAVEFVKLAGEKKVVTVDKRTKARAFVSVGEEDWPFPIPLVKRGTSWYFDTSAGRQEVLIRRIGRNELDAIEICRGYVEAQHEYALAKHDNALVNQYAQRIISSPGKHDGLAWENSDGTWGGTVGDRAAKALEKSYTGKGAPFHGYYFKILTKQGAAAPLGAMDYVQKGAMIGGFALVAYPAVYQVTGVKTFMVSHDGVVYERDFGPKTTDVAAAIDAFNPDRTWTPVLENN